MFIIALAARNLPFDIRDVPLHLIDLGLAYELVIASLCSLKLNVVSSDRLHGIVNMTLKDLPLKYSVTTFIVLTVHQDNQIKTRQDDDGNRRLREAGRSGGAGGA